MHLWQYNSGLFVKVRSVVLELVKVTLVGLLVDSSRLLIRAKWLSLRSIGWPFEASMSGLQSVSNHQDGKFDDVYFAFEEFRDIDQHSHLVGRILNKHWSS